MPRVYLDHAATTPLDGRVREAMLPYLGQTFGNASSLHSYGRAARDAVETAREQVASALGVAPLDVLFTSGGTESDNQAVSGIAWAARSAGRGAHLVTTAIEHHAVIETCEWLAGHAGFEVTVVPVPPDGVLDPERVLGAVRADTVLVSIMAANNELGTVQPLREIGPALRARGVPLHTDAVQAFGRTALDLDACGVAALSLSAHKFNGPQGVGVLVLRRDVAAEPVLHGGGQERGIRSGTLNVAGIVGCGAAAAVAVASMAEEVPRQAALRDRLRDELLAVDGVTLNGHPTARLPSHLAVGVAGCDGEALQLGLDAAGVAVSLGSACQSGATRRSHVLAAIGAPEDWAHVRLTVGRTTTDADVAYAAAAFIDIVKRLRDAGGGYL
jgi:cysteine desulfurase